MATIALTGRPEAPFRGVDEETPQPVLPDFDHNVMLAAR
jgi:hypothetical protein